MNVGQPEIVARINTQIHKSAHCTVVAGQPGPEEQARTGAGAAGLCSSQRRLPGVRFESISDDVNSSEGERAVDHADVPKCVQICHAWNVPQKNTRRNRIRS
jgi:hypothetical protein